MNRGPAALRTTAVTLMIVACLGAVASPAFARQPDDTAPATAPSPTAITPQDLATGGIPVAPSGTGTGSGVPPIQIQPCGTGVTDIGCNVQNFNASWLGFVSFMQNPFGSIASWVRETLFGQEFATGVGALVMGTPDLRESGFTDSWGIVLRVAISLLSLAVGFRVLRGMMQGEPFLLTLTGSGIRMAVVPFAMGMSLAVIDAAASFGRDMGSALFYALSGLGGGGEYSREIMSRLIALMVPGPGFGGLTSAVLGVTVLYVVALMAMRYVMLVFNAIMAPIPIALSGFDTNNEVFKLWMRTTVGASLSPLIVGSVGGLTLRLVAASSQGHGIVNDQVMPAVWAIAGLCVTGKLLHHFTFGAFHGKHFSAVVGGFEAGLLMPLRPLQTASSLRGMARGFMGSGGGAAGGGRMILRSTEAAAGGAGSEMAPGTPLWRAGKEAYDKGLWVRDIEANAAAQGMPQAPPSEKYEAFLNQGQNRDIAYQALAPEHRASSYGGVISTERFGALDWPQVSRVYEPPPEPTATTGTSAEPTNLPQMQPLRPLVAIENARLAGEADYVEELA